MQSRCGRCGRGVKSRVITKKKVYQRCGRGVTEGVAEGVAEVRNKVGTESYGLKSS